MNQCESLIPLKITTIKSCKCYTEYWKTMKMLTFSYVEFNYSIENIVKTYSIIFVLIAFFEIVLSIPLDILEHENLKGHLGCFLNLIKYCYKMTVVEDVLIT